MLFFLVLFVRSDGHAKPCDFVTCTGSKQAALNRFCEAVLVLGSCVFVKLRVLLCGINIVWRTSAGSK